MCTAAAVSSMVSGVVVGVLALGERLPATAPARAARLASWLLVLAGVAGLAAGSGVAELLAPPPSFSPVSSGVPHASAEAQRYFRPSRLLCFLRRVCVFFLQ